MGFGGAFTDAAGFNVVKLSSAAQQNLIYSYFGPQGKYVRFRVEGNDAQGSWPSFLDVPKITHLMDRSPLKC